MYLFISFHFLFFFLFYLFLFIFIYFGFVFFVLFSRKINGKVYKAMTCGLCIDAIKINEKLFL